MVTVLKLLYYDPYPTKPWQPVDFLSSMIVFFPGNALTCWCLLLRIRDMRHREFSGCLEALPTAKLNAMVSGSVSEGYTVINSREEKR